jgi:hypothetical protein
MLMNNIINAKWVRKLLDDDAIKHPLAHKWEWDVLWMRAQDHFTVHSHFQIVIMNLLCDSSFSAQCGTHA